MKKRLLILIAGALLGAGAAFDQAVVRVAPPPPVVEVRPAAPGPRYVWMEGYRLLYGGRYVWVPGHCDHASRREGLDRGPLAVKAREAEPG
jgi:hypothetical protein